MKISFYFERPMSVFSPAKMAELISRSAHQSFRPLTGPGKMTVKHGKETAEVVFNDFHRFSQFLGAFTAAREQVGRALLAPQWSDRYNARVDPCRERAAVLQRKKIEERLHPDMSWFRSDAIELFSTSSHYESTSVTVTVEVDLATPGE